MIAFLRGQLTHRAPGRVVIEVGGVGFDVAVPDSTLRDLPAPRAEVTLLTVLHVREDAMHLYGFRTAEERALFERLQSVTGVGPKVALAILSTLSVAAFQRAVAENTPRTLTVVPGVGKRLAERLVVELRDRLAPGADDGGPARAGDGLPGRRDEALDALVALGVSRTTALDLVTDAARAASDSASAEDLVRTSLVALAGRT